MFANPAPAYGGYPYPPQQPQGGAPWYGGNSYPYPQQSPSSDPFEVALLRITEGYLQGLMNQGQINPDIARETYERVRMNTNHIAQMVTKSPAYNPNDQCIDDTQLANFLTGYNGPVTALLNDIVNEYQMYMQNQQQMQYGYGGYPIQGGYYPPQQPMYGNGYQQQPFGMQQRMNNFVGNYVASMGSPAFNPAATHTARNSAQGQNNAQVFQQQLNNAARCFGPQQPMAAPVNPYKQQMAPQQPAAPVPGQPIPMGMAQPAPGIITPEKAAKLREMMVNKVIDLVKTRKHRVSISKITNDSSMLVNNRKYLSNMLSDPAVPDVVVHEQDVSINPDDITTTQLDAPGESELINVVAHESVSEPNSGTIECSNVEILTPCMNLQEAIDIANEEYSEFESSEQYMNTLRYEEVVVLKVPGMVDDFKRLWEKICTRISGINGVADINKLIVKCIEEAPQKVQDITNAIIFERLNRYIRSNLYLDGNPKVRPVIENWQQLSQLAYINNTSKSNYSKTMYQNHQNEFRDHLVILVKDCLRHIFENQRGEVSYLSPVEHRSQLVRMPEIVLRSGKYRFCDLAMDGGVPEPHKSNLIKRYSEQYFAFTVIQDAYITNLKFVGDIGSDARMVLFKSVSNLEQFTLYSFLLSKKQQCLADPEIQSHPKVYTLVEREDKTITGICDVSVGIDETLLISRG